MKLPAVQRRYALLGITAVVLVLAGSAGGYAVAGGSKLRVVAKASSDFRFAPTQATVGVKQPKQLAIKVVTRPRAKVLVNWSVTCTKNGVAKNARGSFSKAAESRLLPIPLKGGTCAVFASGLRNTDGTVTVSILAKR